MLYLASAPETRMALGFEGSADFIPFDDEVEEGELSERGSPQVQLAGRSSSSGRVGVKDVTWLYNTWEPYKYLLACCPGRSAVYGLRSAALLSYSELHTQGRQSQGCSGRELLHVCHHEALCPTAVQGEQVELYRPLYTCSARS